MTTSSSRGLLKPAILKIVAFLAPCLVSLCLFLVLFNNWDRGGLILTVIVGANAALILLLSWYKRGAVFTSSAKLASWYIMVVLGCWLGIEALFPRVLPGEYSQILNLSQNFLPSPPDRRSDYDVVFDNNLQETPTPTTAAAPASPAVAPMGWHKVAARFAYYGRDPNTGMRYVNAFSWNSRGYYDLEREILKPPDVYRIVVIGDSFVESIQVPLTMTFCQILERMLNSSAHAVLGTQFEVIALGNSGAGQLKNRDTLENEALAFNPDLVLMTLYINDFCDDDPQLSREMARAAGLPTPSFRELASHGYLALAFALRRLEQTQTGLSPELLQWCNTRIPRVETAWQRTLEAVKASRDLCKNRGIQFILLYVGSELEVKHALDSDATRANLAAAVNPEICNSWDMTSSVRRVAAYCEQQGILFASLLDPLIAAQRDTGKFVFGDHYSMFGHEVVANALLRVVDPIISQKEKGRTPASDRVHVPRLEHGNGEKD